MTTRQYAKANTRIPYITSDGEVSYIERLTHIPIIHHSDEQQKHFLSEKVSPEEWNALPFATKLSKDTAALAASRKTDERWTGGWSDVSDMKTRADLEERGTRPERAARFNKRTLLQCAGRHVVGKPDTVVLFHGTTESHMQRMLTDGIRADVGFGGSLGEGFYMTFNPNEAKAYACETGHTEKSNLLAIGEFHVRRARQNRWSCLQGKTSVVRCKTMPNQICFRKDVSDITLVKIHTMDADKMTHHGINGRNSKGRVCASNVAPSSAPHRFATVKHTKKKRRTRTRRIQGSMNSTPLLFLKK
jgi:hypothetical protein